MNVSKIVITGGPCAGKSTALERVKSEFSCVSNVELLPFRKICQTKYDTMKLDFPFGHLPAGTKAMTDKLHKTLEE